MTDYSYISVDLRNRSSIRSKVSVRVNAKDADHKTKTNINLTAIELDPGKSGTIKLVLKKAKPGTSPGPGTLDAAEIVDVMIYVTSRGQSQLIQVDNVIARKD